MYLRFVFLLITRIAAWLRLSRREEAWKTAEILIQHHRGVPQVADQEGQKSQVGRSAQCTSHMTRTIGCCSARASSSVSSS